MSEYWNITSDKKQVFDTNYDRQALILHVLIIDSFLVNILSL